MPMFRAQALLLDMDGTLVDSTPAVERSWAAFARRHNLDYEAIMAVSHGRPSRETIRIIAPHLETPEELQFLLEIELADTDGVRPIEGALELLLRLPPDRWALVTSATHQLAEIRMRAAGLPQPAVLIGSEDVAKGKPDPECYRLGAAALKVSPADCLAIEDAPAGVMSAAAAGAQVIAVTTTYPAGQLPGAVAYLPDLRSVTSVDVEVDGALLVTTRSPSKSLALSNT